MDAPTHPPRGCAQAAEWREDKNVSLYWTDDYLRFWLRADGSVRSAVKAMVQSTEHDGTVAMRYTHAVRACAADGARHLQRLVLLVQAGA